MAEFSPASLAHLDHVHPLLIAIAEAALAKSTVAFGFSEPQCRTLAEEEQKVAQGFSRTCHSEHLIHPDGCGHAIDFVPIVDGQFKWDWDLIYELMVFVREAAIDHGAVLRWGGCWDRTLNALPGTADGLKQAMNDYAARQHSIGNMHPLFDGPHIELHPSTP